MMMNISDVCRLWWVRVLSWVVLLRFYSLDRFV